MGFHIASRGTVKMKRELIAGYEQHVGKVRVGAHLLYVMSTLDIQDGMSCALEHVSVSARNKTPTWDEMCFIKRQFWDEEDEVYQVHPKQSEYINLAKHCLHLWRRADGRGLTDDLFPNK